MKSCSSSMEFGWSFAWTCAGWPGYALKWPPRIDKWAWRCFVNFWWCIHEWRLRTGSSCSVLMWLGESNITPRGSMVIDWSKIEHSVHIGWQLFHFERRISKLRRFIIWYCVCIDVSLTPCCLSAIDIAA